MLSVNLNLMRSHAVLICKQLTDVSEERSASFSENLKFCIDIISFSKELRNMLSYVS
jgi:hypothetical protein